MMVGVWSGCGGDSPTEPQGQTLEVETEKWDNGNIKVEFQYYRDGGAVVKHGWYKEYDEDEINTIIKKAENIEYVLNLRLYELLEDTSYLETAYNQIQEKADNLEPDIKAKFLSYPTPKAIVEEWEKVN